MRAIVYQQLSGKAAATIHARVQALYGGRAPTPAELAGTSAARLRGAGLSRQKLGYLKDLARRAATGRLPLDALDALPDEAVIAALTAVRGVGVWTAQMFLMFRLGRLDVLPVLDLGIQKGMRQTYRCASCPNPPAWSASPPAGALPQRRLLVSLAGARTPSAGNGGPRLVGPPAWSLTWYILLGPTSL